MLHFIHSFHWSQTILQRVGFW